jgi:hypothetical protein
MASDIDDYILERVNRYDQLTIRQLMRLRGYRDSMYSDVQKRFHRMEEMKLLFSMPLTHEKGIGGLTKVYMLGPRGRARLIDSDIEVPTNRFRPKSIKNTGQISVDRWRHRLAVVDLLISAQVWERGGRRINLEGMWTESDMLRSPVWPAEVSLGRRGGMLRYKPDGWIEGTVGRNKFYLAPEIERKGSEGGYGQKRWREKIQKIAAFHASFEDPENLWFPVFAMQGENHQETLLKWAHMELRDIRAEHVAPHIKITTAYPDEERFFWEEWWKSPGDDEWVLLFHSV